MNDFVDNIEEKRIHRAEIDFLRKELDIYKKLYTKRNAQMIIAWGALYHYSSQNLDNLDNKDKLMADNAMKQIQKMENK